MARYILSNHDQMVGEWIAARIPGFEFDPGGYTAIGLINDSGCLIAGVMYEVYTRTDVRMHVAALPGKRWLSQEFLGEVFRYPFVQLGCARVTGLVPASNIRAQELDEHVGFKLEGRLRRMLPTGEDVLIYGMLKEECRFLEIGLKCGYKHQFPERQITKLASGTTRAA